MDNKKLLTETEEMYLVTIRKICEFCENTPTPIPEIAKELGVQPVSASQMINKLADGGYVNYLPYKGVELTKEGLDISTRILRHRRLWEVFLVKVLNMDLNDADSLACQIEHVTPIDVANRLAKFLDNPTVCYHGDPIPMQNGDQSVMPEGISLENLKVGQTSQVIRVNGDNTMVKFLADEGIHPGIKIRLLAIGNDGDRLLEASNKHILISGSVTDAVVISNVIQTNQSEKDRQMTAIPLSDLKVGQKGVIQKLNYKGSIRQKLFAMGLVIGETVLVKRVAPLGDPIDFVVKGYDLSLRKSEARDILVALVKEES